MKEVGIFFGTSTGNTEKIAVTISKRFDSDLFDVSRNPIQEISKYENLIFGTSTWGLGDLQDDWDIFLNEVKKTDLTGKTIALYGLGDSGSYPDTFVDGMGLIYNAIKGKGCKIVGQVDTSDYTFDGSTAVSGDLFVGLALDEDNETKLTSARLNNWLTILEKEFK